MKWLISPVLKVSKFLYGVSGFTLVMMMLLTASDVTLRIIGRPITGAYELVGYFSSIVVGFALPFVTWTRGHVYMEFVTEKLPKQNREIAHIFTRIIGIALFAFGAYYLVDVGIVLYGTGEVSPTLQLPIYPFAWGVAICFFMTCLVLFCDILRIGGEEEYE
jgi:TRAP-type C4-dicarboxylate transport system permease small subunit